MWQIHLVSAQFSFFFDGTNNQLAIRVYLCGFFELMKDPDICKFYNHIFITYEMLQKADCQHIAVVIKTLCLMNWTSICCMPNESQKNVFNLQNQISCDAMQYDIPKNCRLQLWITRFVFFFFFFATSTLLLVTIEGKFPFMNITRKWTEQLWFTFDDVRSKKHYHHPPYLRPPFSLGETFGRKFCVVATLRKLNILIGINFLLARGMMGRYLVLSSAIDVFWGQNIGKT